MQYTNPKASRGTAIIVISLIILLIGLGYAHKKQNQPSFADGSTLEADKPDLESLQMDDVTLSPEAQTAPTSAKPEVSGQVTRQGTLFTSDSPERGNLMLKTANSNFYFHTNRDYTPLIGKKVLVTGQGSVEQFTLIDIIEQR